MTSALLGGADATGARPPHAQKTQRRNRCLFPAPRGERWLAEWEGALDVAPWTDAALQGPRSLGSRFSIASTFSIALSLMACDPEQVALPL